MKTGRHRMHRMPNRPLKPFLYLLLDNQANSVATIGGFAIAVAAFAIPNIEPATQFVIFTVVLAGVVVWSLIKNFYVFYCDVTPGFEQLSVIEIHPAADQVIVCTNPGNLNINQVVTIYRKESSAEFIVGIGVVTHIQERIVQITPSVIIAEPVDTGTLRIRTQVSAEVLQQAMERAKQWQAEKPSE